MDKLKNTIFAMKMTDIRKYPANYEALSTDAALRAEHLACQLRNIIFTTAVLPKPEYMDRAVKAQGIQFRTDGNLLIIRLPGLLPKRKTRANIGYINDPLYCGIKSYLAEHPIPVFTDCVVCFIQVYDRKLPLRRIRDYDNMEFKQILDTISPFVLKDDSGIYCDSYHTTNLGDEDYTLINIMEKSLFPAWLRSRKDQVSDLSEIS